MNLINKISVKTVVGNKTEIKKLCQTGNGAAVPVLRVGGNATGFDSGESTYGPWIVLKGDFQGINLSSGETFRSAKAFLPDAYQAQIITLLSQEGVSSVQVAVDINAHYDEESSTGYTYSTTVLVESDKDPVQEFMNSLPPVADVTPRLNADAKGGVDEQAGEGPTESQKPSGDTKTTQKPSPDTKKTKK